jgi:dienelactone hydrolase
MAMKKIVIGVMVACGIGVFGSFAHAVDLTGTLDGAPYEIRVPDTNWNRTLLVYAHGYRDRADHVGETDNRQADAAPGGELAEAFLLSQGYAIAGSAYKNNGWAVEEGIDDTRALTRFFRDRFGKPDRTILWGFSLGSLVTFRSIEKYPDIYDGAIPACGVGAGTPRAIDRSIDLSLAYDVTFGWPGAWGSIGNVRDDLDFETEVVPVLLAQATNPGNLGRFEFIRLVNRLPAQDFYTGSNWLFTDMFFNTEGRAELERRAGGPVAQNQDHTYSLTPEQIAYLGTLGVNANVLLADMNAEPKVKADRAARRYARRFATPTGKLKRPVITLHTTTDGLVTVDNEAAYRETVEDRGRERFLLQVFTDSVGHCTFTPEQLLSTVKAMESWLTTDSRPAATFFPAALGFVPGFQPPPWPHP